MPNYCTYPQALELFEAVDQAKQDTLIAGVGISIAPDGKTISAPSGTGDMLKSVYDIDNDGIVDKAETLNDGANALSATIPELNYVHGVTGSIQTQLNGKQGTLTFDNVPTKNSANPVKSDGIYDAITDVYGVMGENGAKNQLIPYGYAGTGITGVINSDGSVDLTGNSGTWGITNQAQNNPFLEIFKGKRVRLTGGKSATKYIQWWDSVNGTLKDEGNGVEFILPENIGTFNAIYYINEQVTSEKFYPMLRLASDTDDTYQPYAKTNQQLTRARVQSATFSGTTTANGNIKLYTGTDRMILNAMTDYSANQCVVDTFWGASNEVWGHVRIPDSSGGVRANASVSGVYYYVQI